MFHCFAYQYYSECHGVIYVVDSCDAENLTISSETFSKLQTKLAYASLSTNCHCFPGKVILNSELDGAPLLILANKQDRPVSSKCYCFPGHMVLPNTFIGLSFAEGIKQYGPLGIWYFRRRDALG